MKVVFENEKKVDPIQLFEMKQELCSKYDLSVTRVIEIKSNWNTSKIEILRGASNVAAIFGAIQLLKLMIP